MAGIFLSAIYLAFRCKDRKTFENIVYCGIFSVLTGGLGAKVLYLLVSILSAPRGAALLDTLNGAFKGGFVFYGGLFGFLLGIRLTTRYFGLDEDKYGRLLLPCLPLTHAFGRIGCHLVGCCHGKEVHGLPISIVYENSMFAPNGMPLVPVQLMEATFVFCLFLFLALGKKRPYRRQLTLYLMAYAVFRFIIEFFRGDAIRGLFLGISTSQFISILILLTLALNHVLAAKRRGASSPQAL